MIHATQELLDAARGVAPDLSAQPATLRACGRDEGSGVYAFLWASTGEDIPRWWRTMEDKDFPTCRDCLGMLRDARGPEWDVVASNLADLDKQRTP